MDEQFNLTKHRINKLKEQRKRTGLDAHLLLNEKPEDCPKGVNALIVSAWISGRGNCSSIEAYEYVLNLWAQYPDNPFIEVSQELAEELNVLSTKLKGQVQEIINAPDAPKGLTVNVFQRLRAGKAKTARKLHIEYLLTSMRGQKDQYQRIPLTADIKLALKSLQNVYGGRTKLFEDNPAVPEGLNEHMIANWMNGTVKTVRKDHVEWVLDALDARVKRNCKPSCDS